MPVQNDGIFADGCSPVKVARANEMEKVWFRSERVFAAADREWWFQTREGIDVGPYESQFEAEIEAGLLKELLSGRSDEDEIRDIIRQFVLDSFGLGRRLTPRFRHPLPPKRAGR